MVNGTASSSRPFDPSLHFTTGDDLYAARDLGSFVPWLLATTETNARFLGDPGSNHRFYSIARDSAVNVEATPDQPDAVIDIGGATVGPVAIVLDGPRLRVTFTGTLQFAEAITGPWSDVPSATSPYILAAGYQARFFRARRRDPGPRDA